MFISLLKMKRRRGQAALSLVFLVGGTVILVGVTLTFLVISFINTTFGYQAANKALGVAFAGVNDALWQLSLNRRFHVTAFDCAYDVAVGGDVAEVQVIQYDDTLCGDAPERGSVRVVSRASFLGRARKVEMTISINEVTGELTVASMRQTVTTSGDTGGID